MANIVDISDFSSGRNSIATNRFQTDNLEEYITEQQDDVLFTILGNELQDLFIADLDVNGVPQTQRFIDIYNTLVVEVHGDEFKSKGMKEMLKGIIHFRYVADQLATQNTTGVDRSQNENSTPVNSLGYDFYTRCNNSIEMSWVIQHYICQNTDVYPEYNGKRIELVLPL